MGWRKLNEQEKAAYYKRYKEDHENVAILAAELDAKPSTTERNFRYWAQTQRKGVPLVKQGSEFIPAGDPEIVAANHDGAPTNEELFSIIKSSPKSLDELSKRFDRSKETVMRWITAMQKAGYVVVTQAEKVSFNDERPRVEPKQLPRTLAEEQGRIIKFGSVSDTHCGSAHAQPTALNRFIKIAVEEYGVRDILVPGDITAGLRVYKGQEHDLIPSLGTLLKSNLLGAVTDKQIWTAEQYFPKYDGLRYYMLGGNHDYAHVINSGIDAVSVLCDRRDDFSYLGYDVCDIPLTDHAEARLWHPMGGIPYAKSYKIQKAMEQVAFEELTQAVTSAKNPKLRVLLAGHLHIEVKMTVGPLCAAHVGCFEGRTNLLKRMGVTPVIGGAIFTVHLTDSGMIQRVGYEFISFNEIENDWRNWPVPDPGKVLQEPERVNVIFSTLK